MKLQIVVLMCLVLAYSSVNGEYWTGQRCGQHNEWVYDRASNIDETCSNYCRSMFKGYAVSGRCQIRDGYEYGYRECKCLYRYVPIIPKSRFPHSDH